MAILTSGQASFNTLFLGKTESLISIMDSKFPELGLRAENCTEMSWAKSNLFFSGFTWELPLESLLDRTISAIGSAKSKVKSDYVKDPISMSGLEGICEKLKEVDVGTGGLITAAYGGKIGGWTAFYLCDWWLINYGLFG
ncbi:Tetrahydroberberine oxidase [Linum grandiflorum]